MSETVSAKFTRLCGGLTGSEAEGNAAELEQLLQTGLPEAEAVGQAAAGLISAFETCEERNVVSILTRCLITLIKAPEGQGSALCTEQLFMAAAGQIAKFESAPELFFTECLSLCDLLSSRVSSIQDDVAYLSTFCKLETVLARGFQNQRLSLHVLTNLIDQPWGKEKLAFFIQDIAKFMTHYDEEVAAEAISAFAKLVEGVSESDLEGVVEKVKVALLVVTRGPSVLKLLSVLNFVAEKPNGPALLYEQCFKKGDQDVRVDLELVCDMCDEVGEGRDELYRAILQLVGKMIDEHSQETLQFKKNQQAFITEVGPLVVTLFASGIRDLELCTDVLLTILKHETPPNIEDVFYCLGSLVNGKFITLVDPLVKAIKDVGNIRGYFFEAAAIIEKLESDTTEAAKSICATLRQAQRDAKEKADSRPLKKLQTETKTDKDRVRVLKANANELIRVGPTLARGSLDEGVLKILSDMKDTPLPEDAVDVLLGLFDGICLPMTFSSAVHWREHDSLDFKSFMTQTLPLDVTVGDAVHRVEFPLYSDFLAVEMWYNEKFCNVDGTKLVDAAQRNPKLSQVIQQSDIESARGSRAALLHRACKTPGYKRARFVVSGASFCAYDGLCQAFEHGKTHPYTLEPMAVSLVELPEDAPDERFKQYAHHDTEALNSAMLLFSLLRYIMRAPRTGTRSTVFRQLVMNHIRFAYLDMDKTGIFWSIVKSFPDLIPDDIATLLARSTSFDAHHNIQHMCEVFETGVSSNMYAVFPGTEPFHCRVRRDFIWEDSLALIENLGPGNIDLEIEFVDENGTGKCTVAEFFDAMAQEMCRSSLNLWLVEESQTEFVSVPNNGLYPRPDADPHLIYIVGLAVAKAASMGCVFPIQLHPAVFEVAQCNSPSDIRESIYEEITDEASMINDDIECVYGLVFEFPGLGIPLKEGGQEIDVDDTNAEEFVSLFKEKVVSFELIREFTRGFTQVLPLSALTAFSPKDLPTLFTGKSETLSMSDLQNHVILDGYSPGDIQIKYLFEVLLEMSTGDVSLFLQFVTGCKFLPVDGLGGLSPKLKIRRWDVEDEFRRLPTAITCENVLKLPPYTSKSIFVEKLRIAIHDGREEFCAP